MLVRGVHPGFTTRSLPELPYERCIWKRPSFRLCGPLIFSSTLPGDLQALQKMAYSMWAESPAGLL